jgi:hypothetical protein
MKKKTVFGMVLFVLLVLQAQTVFANGESESVSAQQSPPDARLYFGASDGDLSSVERAIRDGADINFRNGNNYGNFTPLMCASMNGHMNVVQYLVEHGARVNLRNNNGSTAAALAYEKGEIEIYNYLKANGAIDFEPNQVTQQPATPTPQTNVYVQPSASAQNPAPAPAPSAPTFQPGRYAFSGSNITMSLSGYQAAAYSGYEQVAWGTYRINGNQLVITFNTGIGAGAILQGKTFAYTITSNTSFSGSGETWVRTGY